MPHEGKVLGGLHEVMPARPLAPRRLGDSARHTSAALLAVRPQLCAAWSGPLSTRDLYLRVGK